MRNGFDIVPTISEAGLAAAVVLAAVAVAVDDDELLPTSSDLIVDLSASNSSSRVTRSSLSPMTDRFRRTSIDLSSFTVYLLRGRLRLVLRESIVSGSDATNVNGDGTLGTGTAVECTYEVVDDDDNDETTPRLGLKDRRLLVPSRTPASIRSTFFTEANLFDF